MATSAPRRRSRSSWATRLRHSAGGSGCARRTEECGGCACAAENLDEWTGRDLQTALVALHAIADRRALPALLRLLESTRNGNLIVMAKNPVVEIIEADDLAQLKQSLSIAKAACGQPPVPLHLDSLWAAALAKAADSRHIGDIAELLQSGRSDWGLFDALGRIGGAESVTLLKRYLYSGQPQAALQHS